MSLKNPMTPPQIDTGTVRLVAQRLNHYHHICSLCKSHEETLWNYSHTS